MFSIEKFLKKKKVFDRKISRKKEKVFNRKISRKKKKFLIEKFRKKKKVFNRYLFITRLQQNAKESLFKRPISGAEFQRKSIKVSKMTK